MAILNFNSNEVEPSTGIEPIPADKYQAIIIESEAKPTKSGNGEYLELTFEVISGDYKGRRLWSRLNLKNQSAVAVQMARGDLSAICHAIKVPQPRDSAELHNLPLTITVRCKKNPETGELSNEIKSYTSRQPIIALAANPVTPAPQVANAVSPWAKRKG